MKTNLFIGLILFAIMITLAGAVFAEDGFTFELSEAFSFSEETDNWAIDISLPQISGMPSEIEQDELNAYILSRKDAIIAALAAYSDSPAGLYNTGYVVSKTKHYVGGMPVKFRPNGGEHTDQYKAFTVAVPLMRVEEMYLIEAEAAGMQDAGRGQTLLTAFATNRDPSYTFGNHSDAYYAPNLTLFQKEVWWQRRVELWGEGFATFDIKRFQTGVIRSYPNTNHPEDNRWNVDHTPDWMTLCFVRTETNYNRACVQNPTPVKPEADSEEFTW